MSVLEPSVFHLSITFIDQFNAANNISIHNVTKAIIITSQKQLQHWSLKLIFIKKKYEHGLKPVLQWLVEL